MQVDDYTIHVYNIEGGIELKKAFTFPHSSENGLGTECSDSEDADDGLDTISVSERWVAAIRRFEYDVHVWSRETGEVHVSVVGDQHYRVFLMTDTLLYSR